MTTRVCTSCKQEKELDLFRKDNRKPQGRAAICNACNALKKKEQDRRKREQGQATSPLIATSVTSGERSDTIPAAMDSAPIVTAVATEYDPDNTAVTLSKQDKSRDATSTATSNARYPSPKWRRHTFIIRDEMLRTLQAKANAEGRDLTALLDSILSAVLNQYNGRRDKA